MNEQLPTRERRTILERKLNKYRRALTYQGENELALEHEALHRLIEADLGSPQAEYFDRHRDVPYRSVRFLPWPVSHDEYRLLTSQQIVCFFFAFLCAFTGYTSIGLPWPFIIAAPALAPFLPVIIARLSPPQDLERRQVLDDEFKDMQAAERQRHLDAAAEQRRTRLREHQQQDAPVEDLE